MKLRSMMIRFMNFENDTMVESPGTEIVSILQNTISKIQSESFEDLDGVKLLDSNGNTVGSITVVFDDEDELDDDEDDLDDEFDDE